MSVELDRLFEEASTIPTLPVIYTEIRKIVSDPRHSMEDVAKIIEKDTGLTVRLLRLVNSSFYGLRGRVDTVNRALFCIGTRELQNMILCTAVINMFSGISEDLINMLQFWKHSISCGLMAKNLALYVLAVDPDQMFVAGLLHDLGRLLIFKNKPGLSKQILECADGQGLFLRDAEKQVLGYDHCEVAARLLHTWNIPDIIIESVANHHNFSLMNQYEKEAAIIHLADVTVNALQLGQGGNFFVPQLNTTSWNTLALSFNQFESIINQMRAQYIEVVDSFLPRSANG